MYLTLYVPKRLHKEVQKHRGKVNLSRLFRKAFRDYLTDGKDEELQIDKVKKLSGKIKRIKEIIEEV